MALLSTQLRPMSKLLTGFTVFGCFLTSSFFTSPTAWAHSFENKNKQYTCQASPEKFWSKQDLKYYGNLAQCPTGQGFRPLPSTAPAQALFIGYTSDRGRMAFFNTLIQAVQKHQPDLKINVLVQNRYKEDVKSYNFPNPKSVHLVHENYSDTDDINSWPQDFMSLGIFGPQSQSTMLVLPYREDAETEVQNMIAGACQMKPLLAGPIQQDQGNTMGGNIVTFPGHVVVVGSDVDENVIQFLKKEQQVIEIKTDWLPAGHADELFSVAPNGEVGPCNYTILHASSKLGLELLKQSPENLPIDTSISQIPGREKWQPSNCIDALDGWGKHILSKDALACEQFIRANEFYEQRIQKQLEKIKNALKKSTQCENIKTLPLPLLFKPEVLGTKNKIDDNVFEKSMTATYNANPVNSIVLGSLIIVPEQPNQVFEKYIRQALAQQSTIVEFVNTEDLHTWGGDAHCATNVLRACQ